MSRKAIIVDIDGTVADTAHRSHFVSSKPKNFPAFFAAAKDDPPILPIINAVMALKGAGAALLFCSGRPEKEGDLDIRTLTEEWLELRVNRYARSFSNYADFKYDALYMRAAGDYRPDDIVKEELLDRILADGYDPELVFDDRSRVVAMWRRRGLVCAQVAPGDF